MVIIIVISLQSILRFHRLSGGDAGQTQTHVLLFPL